MDFKKDYYKILGIKDSASKEESKAVYRTLAKKYHPDLNPSNQEECSEILKQINEANEVIGNDENKFIYDEYRRNIIEKEYSQTENDYKEERRETTNEKSYDNPNKRTYKKKRTETKERRVYVKGDVSINFWGEQLDDLSINIIRESYYKIYATDVRINIHEKDIYPISSPPDAHKNVYRDTELFKMPLSQPIKCKVISSNGDEYFELVIKDIHIVNPTIEGITKHEGETLGMLKGEVYGYIQHLEYHEVEEEVTECFGETGNIEKVKKENIWQYRKEYYHKDCTTYWGPWVTIQEDEPIKKKYTTPAYIPMGGCGPWFWLLLLIPLILAAPQILLGLIPVALIILMALFGGAFINAAAPFLRIIGGILFLLFLIYGLRSLFTSTDNYIIRNPLEKNRTIKKTQSSIVRKDAEGHDTSDYLISHYIEWENYDDTKFSTTLSIYESDLKNSTTLHQGLSLNFATREDISRVYQILKEQDEKKLQMVYKAFDSIKTQNNFNEQGFAKILVSCVQSFTYSLVFDNSCETINRSDEYITSFLANCKQDCCIGYEKYGVRSPIEFLSDLKGDCDTRALLLYTILQHYNYDVALLTSNIYKHALIAVHFNTDENAKGTNVLINGKQYFLWETTSIGWKPGFISPEMSDLSNWDVNLLSN